MLQGPRSKAACDWLVLCSSRVCMGGAEMIWAIFSVGVIVTPAPALPLWRSRALSLRTPVTIITRGSTHWTHLDPFPSLLPRLKQSAPPFVPCVSINVVMCSCPDAVVNLMFTPCTCFSSTSVDPYSFRLGFCTAL